MESRRSGQAENGHANGSLWQNDYEEESLMKDLLQYREDPSLQGPNMGIIKRETIERTRSAMAAFNPIIASEVLPKVDNRTREEKAAIRIQSHFRGFLARCNYIELLYEQYEKEEQERLKKMRQQVEEGELLVENYRLQTEMDENTCLRRNQRRSLDCTAITIQRAWRDYRRRKYQGSLKPLQTSNPLSAFDTTGQNIKIRTNPFQKINNHSNHNQEGEYDDDDQNDVFNDSLEQATEELSRQDLSMTSDFDLNGSDLSEYSPTDIENIEFPSPTTDWASIESCLNSKEGETQDHQNLELQDLTDKRLTDFSIKANDLRICFVDDALLSDDDDDEDGTDIKEYIIEKQEVDDEEKRDSGCVAGDEEDKGPFSIKTLSPDELVNTSLSEEESQHVMLELSRHENNQEKNLTVQGWTVEKLQALMVHELRSLRDNLSQLIQAQNEVLVRELMMRDALHLKQDSMLLEVEDTTKAAQKLYEKTTHKLIKR